MTDDFKALMGRLDSIDDRLRKIETRIAYFLGASAAVGAIAAGFIELISR